MENIVKGPFRGGLTFSLVSIHLIAAVGICYYPPWRMPILLWVLTYGLCKGGSLGITVGYHRYFTHGAFKCRPWVKYLLAIMGAFEPQGPLSEWVPRHRQHHRYTDDQGDPHSPERLRQKYGRFWGTILGFWWAHIGWLFWETLRPAGYDPGMNPEDAAVIEWQRRWYWLLLILVALLPCLLFGLKGLVWGVFFRIVFQLNVAWLVNSACHLWGDRPPDAQGLPMTNDVSRNNRFVAWFTSGEGWHYYHHACQTSADIGREHHDDGREFIRFLERHRQVYGVRTYPRS